MTSNKVYVVVVTNTLNSDGSPALRGDLWYEMGQVFHVRDYRYNGGYWELDGWDGVNCDKIWILKRHTEIMAEITIIPRDYKIDDNLFEIG